MPEFPGQTHAFFWREVAALRELGHDVQILSTTRPDDEACQHRFAAEARAETLYLAPPAVLVAVRALARTSPRRLARAARYVRSCRRESASATLRLLGIALCALTLAHHARVTRMEHLHVHSCADAAHLGAIARLLGGPTFSLTLHGDLPVYGHDHRLKMAGASFVSTVTVPLRTQVMRETDLPAARVPVIWMGVDTDRFAPATRGADSDGTLQVVTVARLNPTKGHEYALRAMRRLVDEGASLRYIVVGSGQYLSAINSLVDELGLGEVVTMTGALDEDEVRDLLHQSDVFVLPSFGLGEAAPVSVMEAMACGLPVVSTIIGGTADMIDDGVDGVLVPQRDVASLAASLAALDRDAGLRSRLGDRARTRAVEAFDYRTSAGRLAMEMADAR